MWPREYFATGLAHASTHFRLLALPAPRPSTKGSTQSDDKANPETKVESKEKQPVESGDNSTSRQDDTKIKEN